MNYQETMTNILNTLHTYGIPCNIEELWDGYAIRFPWCDGDIAMHSGTYGNSMGYVESYQFSWDEDDVTRMEPATAIELVTHEYITYLRRLSGVDTEEEEDNPEDDWMYAEDEDDF